MAVKTYTQYLFERQAALHFAVCFFLLVLMIVMPHRKVMFIDVPQQQGQVKQT